MTVLRLGYEPPADSVSSVRYLVGRCDSDASTVTASDKAVPVIVSANDVLLATVAAPPSVRANGRALAYAAEEITATDPDGQQVFWLGPAHKGAHVAVIERAHWTGWNDLLERNGIQTYRVYCETLLLPLAEGQWSVYWDVTYGFVRTGRYTGMALDLPKGRDVPTALKILLAEARTAATLPAVIALYVGPEFAEDIAADWSEALGLAVRLAGAWRCETAQFLNEPVLAVQTPRWSFDPHLFAFLRPLVVPVAASLLISIIFMAVDWGRLKSEQRGTHAELEARFRATFPDATAVVDPPLQMRRQLIVARGQAGVADPADFLPLMTSVGAVVREVPLGVIRAIAYDRGQLTVEFAAAETSRATALAGQLRAKEMLVEILPRAQGAGSPILLNVRAP